MNIKLWPFLKHIALVRIALAIIRTFDLQAIKNDFFTTSGDISEEYSSKVVYKIKKILIGDTFEAFIENEILGVVRSLVLEIVKWFLSHNEIVVYSDLDFSTIICWYSYGIIDRFETAKILVHNENINRRRRFVLACKYFFEDHARILWKMLSVDEKLYLAARYGSFASMKFWMDKLQTDDTTNSMQMFHGITGTDYFNKNYLGLRYYFKTLSPEARYLCFSYGIREGEIHHFDLYLCFAEMNIDQGKDLFHRLSASTRLRIMELFLYCPLQSIFVEMLYRSWSFISKYNFRNILRFILDERIKKKWDDVDYSLLVAGIWKHCPTPYKNSLKRDSLYLDFKLLFI